MAKSDISWPDAAEIAATKTLAVHAAQLREEAERVAIRSASVSVSPTYVADAATHLRIGQKPSGGAELMTTVGSILIGLAGGAFISAQQAAGPLVVDAPFFFWMLAGAVGSVLLSVGFSRKARK